MNETDTHPIVPNLFGINEAESNYAVGGSRVGCIMIIIMMMIMMMMIDVWMLRRPPILLLLLL